MSERRDEIVSDVFTRWMSGEYGTAGPETLIAAAVDATFLRLEHDAAVEAAFLRADPDAHGDPAEAVEGNLDTAGDFVATLCSLPDGAMPTATIEVVQYLDEHGEHMVALRKDGDNTWTGWLGLFEGGKVLLTKAMLG